MKKVYLLLFLGLAITLSGCKKQPVIYANHDITACRVDDPLVNLPWLAEICNNAKGHKHLKRMSVTLLLDTVTQDNVFDVNYFSKNGKEKIYVGYGYDCLGNNLYKFGSGKCVQGDGIEKFYKDKVNIGVIFDMAF